MVNPWQNILLSDYENHMKLNQVKQLQTLNKMMKKQFYQNPVKSIMILGIAGGNGLEHIDNNKIDKVYGVDINTQYLDECRKRYPNLDGILKCLCVNLTEKNLELPYVDIIIANLLIEYIGYKCFKNIIKIVKPKYVSSIIQVNKETAFVSNSPYLHVFDDLNKVHHQINKKELITTMKSIGYCLIDKDDQSLPNEKLLVQLDFKRE